MIQLPYRKLFQLELTVEQILQVDDGLRKKSKVGPDFRLDTRGFLWEAIRLGLLVVIETEDVDVDENDWPLTHTGLDEDDQFLFTRKQLEDLLKGNDDSNKS